jgi:hypothetical protein
MSNWYDLDAAMREFAAAASNHATRDSRKSWTRLQKAMKHLRATVKDIPRPAKKEPYERMCDCGQYPYNECNEFYGDYCGRSRV